MKNLQTILLVWLLMIGSVFGQGLIRYSPTTNGAVANGTLANNHVLTWMNPPGIWTNKPTVATATNAIADMSGNGTNTSLFGTIQLGDGNSSGRTTVSNALVIPSGRTNSPLRLNHTNAVVTMTHIPLEGQFFFYDSFDREQTTTNLGVSASGHTWLQYNVRDGVPSAPQVQMTNGYFTLTSAVQSATYQSFSNSFGISNMTRWGGIVEFPTNTAVVGNGYENEATLLLIDRADLTGGAFAHLGFTRSTFGIGYSLITNIFYTNLPVAFPLDAKITVDVQSAGDTMQVHYGPYLFTFRDNILSEVTDKKVSMWEIIGSDTNGVLARWHSVYADWAEPRMALYGNDEIVLRQSAGGAMANQVEYFKSASNSVEVIAGANTTVTPSSSGFRQRFTVASTGGAGSTNNVLQAMQIAIISNNVINPWHAGVVASIYATNGDSQFFTLGSHTNLDYVPFTGADASNHVGVAVAFTQNSTGGFYPTNNGQVIPINTNANRSTMVYYSIANGATNVSVAYPFSMSLSANLDVVEFNTASGSYTNVTSTGSGSVVRSNAPSIYSPALLGTPTLSALQWNVWTNLENTVSNFVFSFATNKVHLIGQTNVVFTNLVELATGQGGDIEVYVQNTTGVTMGLVWPAYGSQHGYHFKTNANNAILSTTSLASGSAAIANFHAIGSNILGTVITLP